MVRGGKRPRTPPPPPGSGAPTPPSPSTLPGTASKRREKTARSATTDRPAPSAPKLPQTKLGLGIRVIVKRPSKGSPETDPIKEGVHDPVGVVKRLFEYDGGTKVLVKLDKPYSLQRKTEILERLLKLPGEGDQRWYPNHSIIVSCSNVSLSTTRRVPSAKELPKLRTGTASEHKGAKYTFSLCTNTKCEKMATYSCDGTCQHLPPGTEGAEGGHGKRAHYCGKQCQREDWDRHSKETQCRNTTNRMCSNTHCSSTDFKFNCAGTCKGDPFITAQYCSKECQRQDWPRHKNAGCRSDAPAQPNRDQTTASTQGDGLAHARPASHTARAPTPSPGAGDASVPEAETCSGPCHDLGASTPSSPQQTPPPPPQPTLSGTGWVTASLR